MTLDWKPSTNHITDWIAQGNLINNKKSHFYRIECAGPRTWILKIDSRFHSRYRTDVAAKEAAQEYEDKS